MFPRAINMSKCIPMELTCSTCQYQIDRHLAICKDECVILKHPPLSAVKILESQLSLMEMTHAMEDLLQTIRCDIHQKMCIEDAGTCSCAKKIPCQHRIYQKLDILHYFKILSYDNVYVMTLHELLQGILEHQTLTLCENVSLEMIRLIPVPFLNMVRYVCIESVPSGSPKSWVSLLYKSCPRVICVSHVDNAVQVRPDNLLNFVNLLTEVLPVTMFSNNSLFCHEKPAPVSIGKYLISRCYYVRYGFTQHGLLYIPCYYLRDDNDDVFDKPVDMSCIQKFQKSSMHVYWVSMQTHAKKQRAKSISLISNQFSSDRDFAACVEIYDKELVKNMINEYEFPNDLQNLLQSFLLFNYVGEA